MLCTCPYHQAYIWLEEDSWIQRGPQVQSWSIKWWLQYSGSHCQHLTCSHRFLLFSLLIPQNTSHSKLCLLDLSFFLCPMLLFANVFLYSPWGLSRLVSNLVSHRIWNNPGAIWGLFTAYFNSEHAFFALLPAHKHLRSCCCHPPPTHLSSFSHPVISSLLEQSTQIHVTHVMYCWQIVSVW